MVVTHVREQPLPNSADQVFSFFGRERVRVGVYALTAGDGQPPVARLRGASDKHSLQSRRLQSISG